jgi:hypothetical protein
MGSAWQDLSGLRLKQEIIIKKYCRGEPGKRYMMLAVQANPLSVFRHSIAVFLISLKEARYNRNVTMAITTKIITSHFAISIEKPAIPRAPRMNATRARIRKTTAR